MDEILRALQLTDVSEAAQLALEDELCRDFFPDAIDGRDTLALVGREEVDAVRAELGRVGRALVGREPEGGFTFISVIVVAVC